MSSQYLSAIDIGTNSFHMIVVEVSADSTFKIIEREREVIRLSAKSDNLISDSEIETAIKILKSFKNSCQYYNARIKAVATSAVREALNKDQFLNIILKETGIEIEVIDGKREAELIYLGARKALNLDNKKVICIDIGGGSTEIIYDNLGTIEHAESFGLGAVRLSRMFFPNYKLNIDGVQGCTNFIETELNKSKIQRKEDSFDLAVGTSGTIQATASLINYIKTGKNLKNFNNFRFSYEEFKTASDLVLSCITKEERLRIGGMEEKRGDIIPAGMLILDKFFELFRIESLTVSSFALREGIILEQLSLTQSINTF